jgi:mannose-6-phosphate isomerase-like protein (cupin superfamily)
MPLFLSIGTGSIAALVLSIGVMRLIPDPERTAHVFVGDAITVAPAQQPFSEYTQEQVSAESFRLSDRQPPGCGEGTRESCAGAKCAPPYHLHTRQNETFIVRRGQMQYVLDGQVGFAEVGERVFVPAGRKHTFCRSHRMAADDELRVEVVLEPALNSAAFFPNLIGLLRDSGFAPSPVRMLFLFCAHHVRLADIPAPLHDALCATIQLVAPLAGYTATYPEYAL